MFVIIRVGIITSATHSITIWYDCHHCHHYRHYYIIIVITTIAIIIIVSPPNYSCSIHNPW